MEYIVLKNLKT